MEGLFVVIRGGMHEAAIVWKPEQGNGAQRAWLKAQIAGLLALHAAAAAHTASIHTIHTPLQQQNDA